jgi:hypothetical protein
MDVIKFITKHIEKENFTIIFKNSKYMKEPGYGYYMGSFDIRNKTIIVCMKNMYWKENLLHEYCHFLQYINRNKTYIKSIDSYSKYIDFINGDRKTLSYEDILSCMKYERQADMMVIKLCKKYNISLNISEFIRESNYYTFTFSYLYFTGDVAKQLNKKDICNIPSVYKPYSYYFNKSRLPWKLNISNM